MALRAPTVRGMLDDGRISSPTREREPAEYTSGYIVVLSPGSERDLVRSRRPLFKSHSFTILRVPLTKLNYP